MSIIPLFRVIAFTFITLLSLVVLGICAHIEYLTGEYTDIYLSFAPFGLGVSCLTVLSLPLFLGMGNLRRRVFTSSILFEIIWFFILWVLWVGTAGDSVAGKAYHFPAGCVYDNYPTANQICYEFTIVQVFSFLNFVAAFVYYDVIFLYAIICAIRGRGIWTSSVKEVANDTPCTGNPAPIMVQPQFNAAPAMPYGAYVVTLPPQTYNTYAQPVPPPAPLAQPYSEPYTPYAWQMPPQSAPPQPYSAYTQQAPPQSPPQPPNYVGYSPSPPTNAVPLPPQLTYAPHPAHGSQAQLALPSGYPEQPLPSPYASHVL